nr:zf-TFIIB domain-containing protein [Kofleriaceae bacterium]
MYRDARPLCLSCEGGLTREDIHREVEIHTARRTAILERRTIRFGTWLRWHCDSCHAELLADDHLATLLDDATLDVRGLDRRLRRATAAPTRRCPCCVADMTAHLLYDTVVDRCRQHGVWLDPGERDRVLASARLAAGTDAKRTERAGLAAAGFGAGATVGLGAAMSLAALAPAAIAGGALALALAARARRRRLAAMPDD